jgi:hypothetical protein
MAMLVHLTGDGDVARIRRAGLSVRRDRTGLRGVYAVPMVPDFTITHQWLREVKQWKTARTLVAVDFRIPDDELVLAGRYHDPHAEMTAAEAVALVLGADDARGYEVIVRRSIRASEIHRVRSVPQKVGWRHWPDAHGRRPCGCPACLVRGQPRSAGIRRAYQAEEADEG